MTTTVAGGKPSPMRRAAAALALAALAAALLFLAVAAIHRWDILLVRVVSLGVAVVAAWHVLSRRGAARVAAAVLAAVALVVFVVVMVASQSVRVLAVGLGLAAVSVIAAGYALTPAASVGDTERAPDALHPVLLMNPRSGGGTVERFGLVDLCRQRGIEPYVLRPGDDLRQVAEEAIARSADLLGMAAGDGSLAIVDSVASRHGIPFVVVPAGTRNHFALDLGLDRADVPGALDAYHDGVDTAVDLAEINGRGFVNNASMGVYAEIVQSADYRDAKVQTAAAMLPDQLGPGAKLLDLHYTLPSGQEAVPRPAAACVQQPVRPGAPARRRHPRAHRRRRAWGRLAASRGGGRRREACRVGRRGPDPALRRLERVDDLRVEVRSAEPMKIGVDGEALVLEPPLHFVIRPAAVTVRLPRTAPRRSPAERTVRVTAKPTLVALWRTATGRSTGTG